MQDTTMAPLSLERSVCRAISSVLATFCGAADVRYAALLEESGMMCADAGDETLRDHGETAALAVGAYAAVQEVARRLGDDAFTGLHHQGAQRHFLLSPVGTRFILLSVFGEETRFAIVSACAAKAGSQLAGLLNGEQPAPALPTRFDHRGTAEGDLLIAGDYFMQV